MQREFSKELAEDRQFEIGGELFEWTYPHWEIGAQLWDGSDAKEEAGEDGKKNGNFSFRADTEFAIQNIPLLLNPKNDAQKRWKALVARKADPVPRHQFIQLYRWLFEQVSGLPTSPPSGSEPGGGSSEELSEGESS
jgi:hypothetical protein